MNKSKSSLLKLKILNADASLVKLDLQTLLNYDFTIPLIKGVPVLDRGRKVSKAYYMTEEDLNNKVKTVEKIFTDELVNGQLDSIIMNVNYYNDNNTIAASKTEKIHLGHRLGYEMLETRRHRAMSDLKSRAIYYGHTETIEKLYSFFYDDLRKFYETGSNDFAQRIIFIRDVDLSTINDADKPTYTEIQTILNSKLDTILKASDAILYQIS